MGNGPGMIQSSIVELVDYRRCNRPQCVRLLPQTDYKPPLQPVRASLF
jgi:hypothetical protein